MAATVRRLPELVGAGLIPHDNNPVLSWMAANAATLEDDAGNLKWAKAKSGEKTDGIVAATITVGRAMVRPQAPMPSITWI